MKRAIIIVLLAFLGASNVHAASFETLESPYVYGSLNPIMMSDDGSIITISDGSSTYTWQSGVGNIGLGDAQAITPDNTYIVGGGSQAYRWENGTITYLGYLPHHTGSSRYSCAYGVSPNGSVVVGAGSDNNHNGEAFRWKDGEMLALGFLPGAIESRATAVSGNGNIVAGSSGNRAFRWESGLMIELGDLPGGNAWSTVLDISYDGAIILGQSESGNGPEPFIWNSGAMTGLGDLPGGDFASMANDFTADGSIAVGWGTTDEGKRAFLWDDTQGMRDLKFVLEMDYGLDLTGWTLYEAYRISENGMSIVGYGHDGQNFQLWAAQIPEPAVITLLSLGSLWFMKNRKKNRGGVMAMRHHINRIYLIVLCCIFVFTATSFAATIDSSESLWREHAKLVSPDGDSGDQFGGSVAMYDNICVIGAAGDDENGNNSGAAYIFVYDGDAWSQTAKLMASDGRAGDHFGCSVALHGNYCIVGAFMDDAHGLFSGSAYIFAWDGDQWTEQAKLTASDGKPSDFFGHNVSIHGDYCIVGAHGVDDNGVDSGAVYLYHRNGDQWLEQAKLTPTDGAANDWFGFSVSMSEGKCLAGAYGDDAPLVDSGSAYVFNFDGNEWAQQAKLVASDSAMADRFGYAVAMDGDQCLVGSMYCDIDKYENAGASYVFTCDGNDWTEQAKLLASDGSGFDGFGCAASIYGAYCVVGSSGDDDLCSSSGSAYVFHHDGNGWIQLNKLTGSDGRMSDLFGGAVSIWNDYCLAGVSESDENAQEASGSAYLYKLSNCPRADLDNDCDVDVNDLDILGGRWLAYKPDGFFQEQKFDATNLRDTTILKAIAAYDSVAVVGDTGDATKGTGAGAAYILGYNGEQWQKQVKLIPSDLNQSDSFGNAVSVWEDHCIIGAYTKDYNGQYYVGAAYAYHFNGNQWVYLGKMLPSSTGYYYFGTSVAVYGDTCVIGSPGEGSSNGAMYIYTYDGGHWNYSKRLTVPGYSGYGRGIGRNVAIWGNNCIAGAHSEGDHYTGGAYIFQNLSQQVRLAPPEPDQWDHFGIAVSICGDYCVVGSQGDNDKGTSSGSAYIFHYNGTDWVEQAKLTASDGQAYDEFGSSVCIYGDYCIVGSQTDDQGSNAGSAYLFKRQGTDWIEVGKLNAQLEPGTYFGRTVTLFENRCLVAAYRALYFYEAENKCDFNRDHAIDFQDYSQFSLDWLQQGNLFP